MSQGDVLEVLKKARKPILASQIAEKLEINEKHIFTLLNSLIKFEEVKCIEITREEAKERFGKGYNRRIRLYYVA